MLSRNVLVIGSGDFLSTRFGVTVVQTASGFGDDNSGDTALFGTEEDGDMSALIPMQSESSVFDGSSESFPERKSE